jgi:sugar lactone lactonase YvrE
MITIKILSQLFCTKTMKTILSSLIVLTLANQTFGKTIPNYPAADLVLGQSDFVSNALPSPISASSLNRPTAVTIDPVTRKVFVLDSANRRILRYSSVESLTSGASAEVVFGQPNFTTNLTGVSGFQFGDPQGMFLDRNGRLWVADARHNRVLMFSLASLRTDQPHADRVYGQQNFTSTLFGSATALMSSPRSVWVDNADRLWVSDSGNNRILRFDSVTTKANGASANGVLGTSDFVMPSDKIDPRTISNPPAGLAVSASGTLFVATSNRVLRYDNAAALSSGATASVVLGQPGFATTLSGLSATQMNQPFGIWITPDDSLWISDSMNHRIIRFDNVLNKTTGSQADGVVGQPDFVTGIPSTSAKGLRNPAGQPFIDSDGSLWAPDSLNHRVLRYSSDKTAPIVNLVCNLPKSTKKKQITIHGYTTDESGVSSVQFRNNNGPLRTATGAANWQFNVNLRKGKNKITVIATDSTGNVSVEKIIKINRK